jgi:hypothetical protein
VILRAEKMMTIRYKKYLPFHHVGRLVLSWVSHIAPVRSIALTGGVGRRRSTIVFVSCSVGLIGNVGVSRLESYCSLRKSVHFYFYFDN